MRVSLFRYMFCFSVLNSRIDSGHTWRSHGSGPGSQVPKVCFFGGNQKKFARRSVPVFERICFGRNRNPRVCEAKQKTVCRTATAMPRTGDGVKTGIQHGG